MISFARDVVLQCICVAILLAPLLRWIPGPDEAVMLAAGLLIGVGTTLQFQRQRAAPDRR